MILPGIIKDGDGSFSVTLAAYLAGFVSVYADIDGGVTVDVYVPASTEAGGGERAAAIQMDPAEAAALALAIGAAVVEASGPQR